MNKTYPVECHVCGKRFEIVRSFVSWGYLGTVVGEDGIERGYHSCGAHTAQEVRAVYNRMTGQTEDLSYGRF